MQVTLGLEVNNGLMILPAGYHGYEKYNQEHAQNSPEDLGPCLMLSLPMLQLQLRTNDYYMGESEKPSVQLRYSCNTEMSLNLDTLSGRISEHCYNDTILSSPANFSNRREKIVVDGMLL